MPYIPVGSGASRPLLRFLGCAILTVAMTGCAGTPNKMGIPWWPQGPGNTPEDVAPPARSDQATASPAATAPATAIQAAQTPPPPQAPSSPANTAQALPPPAPAPSSATPHAADSYTQAVRYGDLLFVSGQIANDPATRQLVGNDIEGQVRAAMDNVRRVLESHGMTMSNVLSVTMYLRDVNDLPKLDPVYESFFRRSLPARTIVQVSGLPRGSLVEISVIAGK